MEENTELGNRKSRYKVNQMRQAKAEHKAVQTFRPMSFFVLARTQKTKREKLN